MLLSALCSLYFEITFLFFQISHRILFHLYLLCVKFTYMKNIIFFLIFITSNLFSDIIYRVPIEGTIDLGLPPFIKRVLDDAEKNSASAVIFDINTFGGRVDAATQIKDVILASDIITIAFINRRAISAGALIVKVVS